MKTYTEQEVEQLLKTQRGNCWVALNYLTKDRQLLDPVINAPEPGSWRNKKKYFAVFGHSVILDLEAIPKEFDAESFRSQISNMGLIPVDLSTALPFTETKIEISKETVAFVKNTCNIERDNYGEDTYVMNNSRFKIVEE